MDFHCEDPKDLEIDQIVDFLYDLKDVKHRNWHTIKIYVAGLRWYYQDEVGVEKSTPDQTGGYFESLYLVHQKATKVRLWANVEVFCFIYKSPNI